MWPGVVPEEDDGSRDDVRGDFLVNAESSEIEEESPAICPDWRHVVVLAALDEHEGFGWGQERPLSICGCVLESFSPLF